MRTQSFKFILNKTIAIMVAAVFISSCSKDNDAPPAEIPLATVNFSSTSLNIEENSSSALNVDLSLSKELEEEGTVTISIDNAGTASSSDYSTNPESSGGTITLDLAEGESSASFSVSPIDNSEPNEDKTIVFKISSADGGIELGTSDLTATVTITNEDESTDEEEEEEETFSGFVLENFDGYDLSVEPTDLDGLGSSDNGWGGPWKKFQGKFLLKEGNIPADDIEGDKHAVTDYAGDKKNIHYYRPLAQTWKNTAGAEYWLGFQFSPITVGPWAGFSLYLDDNEILQIGIPYKSGKQGVSAIAGENKIIEGSQAADKTWFVVKMVMSGPNGAPHLYVWRNPDPTTEPDVNNADVSVAWPDAVNGFNRIRIGNSWHDGASIAYDHIRISTDWEEIPYQE